jgi:hypothetical protein
MPSPGNRPASTPQLARSSGPGEDDQVPAGPQIDLDLLAKRVFALLKQELRVERERLGRHGSRRGG